MKHEALGSASVSQKKMKKEKLFSCYMEIKHHFTFTNKLRFGKAKQSPRAPVWEPGYMPVAFAIIQLHCFIGLHFPDTCLSCRSTLLYNRDFGWIHPLLSPVLHDSSLGSTPAQDCLCWHLWCDACRVDEVTSQVSLLSSVQRERSDTWGIAHGLYWSCSVIICKVSVATNL